MLAQTVPVKLASPRIPLRRWLSLAVFSRGRCSVIAHPYTARAQTLPQPGTLGPQNSQPPPGSLLAFTPSVCFMVINAQHAHTMASKVQPFLLPNTMTTRLSLGEI